VLTGCVIPLVPEYTIISRNSLAPIDKDFNLGPHITGNIDSGREAAEPG
jgi:hypothetical protein